MWSISGTLDPKSPFFVATARALARDITHCFCAARRQLNTQRLLELNLGSHLFELRLDLLGFILGHALFHGLGRAFDELLGLLEA